MREERIVMGMPARVELVGAQDKKPLDAIFELWRDIDERFSTYKDSSEISRINRKEIHEADYSGEMHEIFSLAEKTASETAGFFDIKRPDGDIDPSGIVKGWAIQKAAELARRLGFDSYYLEIGGDIQTSGRDSEGKEWSVGIRNPFNRDEVVKVLYPAGAGVATSGSAIRGRHIYNPHDPSSSLDEIVSITVIGPNIYEADRFATAAFAMGRSGISFIDSLAGFEGYAIDRRGVATMTAGIDTYLQP
jgi:thiamine biosynthesis lipoprotein